MTEHLNLDREYLTQVAPSPAGIINFPAENGIDPSLPPPAIQAEALAIGVAVVRMALGTSVNELLGEIPYSEARVESLLDGESKVAKDTQEASEAITLEGAAGSPNPAVRIPAAAALEGRIPGRNSINTPSIAKAEQELHTLEAKRQRGGTLSLQEQQRIGTLRNEVKRLKGANSNPIKRRRSRKREYKARQDMARVGYSEERVAEIMDSSSTETRKGRKETREREELENKETRNIVGRIGSVIRDSHGDRWIVKDVVSQPAQGFKIIGYKPDPTDPTNPKKSGGPIFESEPLFDLATGQPILDAFGNQVETEVLHDLYAAFESFVDDPSSPTGKRKVTEYKLVPRDDPYLRDRVRQSGLDSNFYFKEDLPPGVSGPDTFVLANPAGIGDDSFSPIDDKVTMQRLFSGAEAVDYIVNGNRPDIEDWTIRIGDLARLVDEEMAERIKDSQRDLESHLVFLPSDEVIDEDYADRYPGRSINDPVNMSPLPGIQTSGLLAPYDASQAPGPSGDPTKRLSGHFRRFNYVDPRTSRQVAQEEHLERVGVARVVANLAKPLAGRGKKLPKI